MQTHSEKNIYKALPFPHRSCLGVLTITQSINKQHSASSCTLVLTPAFSTFIKHSFLV